MIVQKVKNLLAQTVNTILNNIFKTLGIGIYLKKVRNR